MTSAINKIAADFLGIESLEPKTSVEPTFCNPSTTRIKLALNAAYHVAYDRRDASSIPIRLTPVTAITRVVVKRASQTQQLATNAISNLEQGNVNRAMSYISDLVPVARSIQSLCESAIELHQRPDDSEIYDSDSASLSVDTLHKRRNSNS